MFNTVIVPDHELLTKFMEKPNLLCTVTNDLFQVHYYFRLQNASTSFVRNEQLIVLEPLFRICI